MSNNSVNIDFINGSVGDVLLKHNFDADALRPFIDPEAGGAFVNNGSAVVPVHNATLLVDEWKEMDKVVTKVARERLNFVQDLLAMGLVKDLPNAMGKTVYQKQQQSDISDATVSMSGLSKGDNDRPDYSTITFPIPIIHKDFYFDAREIALSRNGSQPLDMSAAELGSRKVSEAIEKLHLGTYGTYKFAGGNLYGLCNYDKRNTTTYTDWDASAKTNETRFDDILNFIALLRADHYYGPYGVYVAPNLVQYLDQDYKANSDITLRQRIQLIGSDGGRGNKVQFVRDLDYLADDAIVVVQLTSDVFRTIQGMNTRVVQWSSEGGMRYNFKVMAIMVPDPYGADYDGRCGILHATKTT